MINHCNNVILARVSVLKSHVHVCNDFAPESIWAVRVVTAHGVRCSAMTRVFLCANVLRIVASGH